MIREDMDLSDDEEINYGEFINKKKMEFTKESENFIGSARERFFYNAEKQKKQKPTFGEAFKFFISETPLFGSAQAGRENVTTVREFNRDVNKLFEYGGNVAIVNPYLERVKN